jgi:hypothetical protein
VELDAASSSDAATVPFADEWMRRAVRGLRLAAGFTCSVESVVVISPVASGPAIGEGLVEVAIMNEFLLVSSAV